jgi:hypothetical protein
MAADGLRRGLLSLSNVLDGSGQASYVSATLRMFALASSHSIDAARIRNSSALIR